MDKISAALIDKALEGLMLRYQYTAQNIANANTPGYAPVHVTFEDSLKAAASGGIGAITDVTPQVSAAPADSLGSDVRLDLELAAASQTAMRYRALLDMLGRQMAIHRAAVSQGGR
jgi:flagellar basal-body rod protein FlgB